MYALKCRKAVKINTVIFSALAESDIDLTLSRSARTADDTALDHVVVEEDQEAGPQDAAVEMIQLHLSVGKLSSTSRPTESTVLHQKQNGQWSSIISLADAAGRI